MAHPAHRVDPECHLQYVHLMSVVRALRAMPKREVHECGGLPRTQGPKGIGNLYLLYLEGLGLAEVDEGTVWTYRDERIHLLYQDTKKIAHFLREIMGIRNASAAEKKSCGSGLAACAGHHEEGR